MSIIVHLHNPSVRYLTMISNLRIWIPPCSLQCQRCISTRANETMPMCSRLKRGEQQRTIQTEEVAQIEDLMRLARMHGNIWSSRTQICTLQYKYVIWPLIIQIMNFVRSNSLSFNFYQMFTLLGCNPKPELGGFLTGILFCRHENLANSSFSYNCHQLDYHKDSILQIVQIQFV